MAMAGALAGSLPQAGSRDVTGHAGRRRKQQKAITRATSQTIVGDERPNAVGRFGRFGGRYVPETLIPALDELSEAYERLSVDPTFKEELEDCLRGCVGRPTPLMHAGNVSQQLERDNGKRVDVYLKREDLCHTGAHKINNALGQALVAKRLNKSRVVAETGAGQHGLATATACALMELECVVYMGAEDMARQAPNVSNMRLRGAKVVPVHQGSATLKDATSEAIRDWVTNVHSTHYILGSAAGPHPYPRMVRDLQSCIGKEVKSEFGNPDCLLACIGGGSNAIGLFDAFVHDSDVRLVGVEAAGHGLHKGVGNHAATLGQGRPGVLHGSFSILLQDYDGHITEPHSVSAGLDYPGVGPEHAYLQETGRCQYVSASDDEALRACSWLARTEGIVPAIETSHALARLPELSADLPHGSSIVVNLSGSGKKDVEIIRRSHQFHLPSTCQ